MDLKQRSILSIIQCLDSKTNIETNINYIIEQLSIRIQKGPIEDVAILENFLNILKIKFEQVSNEEYYSKEKIEFIIHALIHYIEKMNSKHLKQIPIISDIFQVLLNIINPSFLEDIIILLLNKLKLKLIFFISKYMKKSKVNQVVDIIPELYLKLLETIFEVLLNKKYKKIKLEKFLKDDELIQLIVKMICFSDAFLAVQTILWIVPKYLKLVRNNQLLIILWNTLIYSTNLKRDNELKKRSLLVLCLMMENFFPKTPDNIHYLLLNLDYFWEFLQENLLSKNYQIRKQALFLLKRAITISSGYQINVKYFQQQPIPEDSSIWSYFFLIIESLEERQMFRINPSFEFIIEICENIHITWSILLYKKMLSHSNNSINLWAILHLDYLDFTRLGNESYAKDIISCLVPILNHSLLYSENFRDKVFQSLKYHFLKIIQTEIHALIYFQQLLEFASNISWDPISFFCFSYILSLLGPASVYNSSSIYALKSYLESSVNDPNHYIRCATESCIIRQIVNLADCRSLSLYLLGDFIGILRRDSIRRKSNAWEAMLNFLISFSTEETVYNFILYNITTNADEPRLPPKSLARIVLLLLDTNKITSSEKTHSLVLTFAKLVQDLTQIQNRPYEDNWSEELILFINYFYKELNNDNDETSTSLLIHIKQIFQTALINILDIIFERIQSCTFLRDYLRLKIYNNALTTLLQLKPLEITIENYVLKKQASLFQLYKFENESIIQKVFFIKFLTIICNMINFYQSEILDQLSKEHLAIIQELIENGFLNFDLEDEFDLTKLTRDLKLIYDSMNDDFMENKWFLYKEYIKLTKNFILQDEDLLESVMKGIKESNQSTLVNILHVVEIFIKENLSGDSSCKIPILIEHCYKATFELKKSRSFLPAILLFCSIIFQPPLILGNLIDIKHYADNIFQQSETIPEVIYIFIYQLYTICKDGDADGIVRVLINPFVRALTYGEVGQRGQRLFQNICDFIESQEYYIYSNATCESTNLKEYQIRLHALKILLELTNEETLTQLLHQLLLNEITSSKMQKNYSVNSFVHRSKLRTLQIILILDEYISIDDAQKLFDRLFKSLEQFSHPSNIKYFIQWVLARITMKYELIRNTLWNIPILNETNIDKVISWISIIYFLYLSLRESKDSRKTMKLALEKIVSLTMSENEPTKIHAQFVFKKLFEECQDNNYEEYINKYESIYMVLAQNDTNLEENFKKEKKFCFINNFHPIHNFNLKTIFHYLPKLTEVHSDELIPLFELDACPYQRIQIDSLKDFLQLMPVEDEIPETFDFTKSKILENFSHVKLISEKKSIPWKEILPQNRMNANNFKSEIIVCATFIGRISHLGSLARTCEILAVPKLILNNINYLNDKEFKSFSMNAEKWLTIEEVKVRDLANFMIQIKMQGYTLIGREQASESVSLFKINFPEKTFLLLGNEKTGIPSNLLPLLDICVEIPEHGNIRGMNDIVSGSLLIWEYTRQHTKLIKS